MWKHIYLWSKVVATAAKLPKILRHWERTSKLTTNSQHRHICTREWINTLWQICMFFCIWQLWLECKKTLISPRLCRDNLWGSGARPSGERMALLAGFFCKVWPISLMAACSVASVTKTRQECADMLRSISLGLCMCATTVEPQRNQALPLGCIFILITIFLRVLLANNICLLELEELLVQNMTKSTNQMGRTEWTCNHCGKSNSDKSKIKTHVQTHLHLEHFCPHCSKPAKNPEALKTHMRTFHKMF